MKVLVVGGVSYDHIIHIGELPCGVNEALFAKEGYYMVGGTGTGKAMNLSKLGFDVSFQFRIGSDDAGQKIREYFAQHPIHTIIEIDDASTECHTNLMDDEGKRISIYTDYLTFEPDIELAPVLSAARESDQLVVNIMNYCRNYLPGLKQLNKPIWVDIHDYDGTNTYHQDFIEAADFLFISSEQMTGYRSFMVQQIEQGKTIVVCTHGKLGASCLTNSLDWYEQDILEHFDRIDTNGAGDAFMSGFMFGYCQQYPIPQCMEFGAICAGHAISSKQLFGECLNPSALLQNISA